MTAPPARVRVLFFSYVLGGGGAEMQALRVANHLDRKRFDVRYAVAESGGSYESALAEDIKLHVLGGTNVGAKTRALRALIHRERADIVCSFLEFANVMAAAAALGLRPRPHVVACVQAPPSITWKGGGWRPFFRALISFYYSRAERIIALSAGVADDVAQMAPGAEKHMDMVHNAGLDDRLESLASIPLDTPRPDGPLLIACGRLTAQKGFPYLIDAFAIVRKQFPDAQLWILGEGPDRGALERQIADLSLKDSVKLLGFRDNPYGYMAAADVFVLSSVFEGFANVVAEAMACGAAVVSTDCPYGPSEIITDEVDGLLVPTHDPAALARAIMRVLGDDRLRAKLAKAGRKRAQAFAASTIADHYGEVFESVLPAK